MRGRLLYLCVGGGTDLAPAPWHLPHRRARWHRRADDANVRVCAAGAATPEPEPGGGGREEWSGSARRADRREIVVCGRGECVGGRGEGLDSPGGRIGVSLLTGAKFGDRMKKIFSEFFVLDFMRTEKFREDIV